MADTNPLLINLVTYSWIYYVVEFVSLLENVK